jgi:hypothetical protein
VYRVSLSHSDVYENKGCMRCCIVGQQQGIRFSADLMGDINAKGRMVKDAGQIQGPGSTDVKIA